MPILSDLSRRFYMLTTDAKPDPPRIEIEGHTNNLLPENESKTKHRSASSSSSENTEQSQVLHDATTFERQKSTSDEATPSDKTATNAPTSNDESFSAASDTKDSKKTGTKTKPRFKQTKHSQSKNVINYNIVNSRDVKIGARTSYICNINQFPMNNSAQSEVNASKPKSKLMPEHVASFSTCNDQITLEDMFIVKTHIGHGWKDMARRLFYSDGQIEQFEDNYRYKGIDEVVYQLLLDWKRIKASEAQIGKLINVLWLSEEYDCTERLVKAHKNISYKI